MPLSGVIYVNMNETMITERHPWEAFVPPGARVLVMGTFPPGENRRSMDFYYPNRTNDFWYVMGMLFFGERDALYCREERTFRLDRIKALLTERGIALGDTGREVRRLRGNASDKYLEIVEPVDLDGLLARMPLCHDVATTGEKAAGVVASLTSTSVPRMGEWVADDKRGLRIWRMPSTSRAFPMRAEAKAEFYRQLFLSAGVL